MSIHLKSEQRYVVLSLKPTPSGRKQRSTGQAGDVFSLAFLKSPMELPLFTRRVYFNNWLILMHLYKYFTHTYQML